MKYKTLLIALSIVAFANFSGAAVTMSSTAVRGIKTEVGANVAAGNLVLIVVDADGSGTFGAAANNVIDASTNLGLGQTLLGDLIVGGGGTQSAFGQFTAPANASIDEGIYAGRAFALLWFASGTTSGSTSVADGTYYGLVTDPTWVVPAAGGSYDFANPVNPTGGAPFLQIQNGGNAMFVTGIPEPSRAILAGLGLMGLFFRRRR